MDEFKEVQFGNIDKESIDKDKKVLRFANMLPYPLPSLSQKRIGISA